MVVKKSESEKSYSVVKLKDRLEYLDKGIFEDTSVENPFDKLTFREYKKKYETKNNVLGYFSSYNFGLFVLVVFLLSTSILFNRVFLEKLDPKIFKVAFRSVSFTKKAFVSSWNFFVDQIKKPYVVTLGEFGNFAIAKEEAIAKLPKLRQVDIKQLNGGIYTFEIERFASKEKAYSLANGFIKDGFDAVHVRYLPDQ
ncbi:MAG: hypothetical protein HY094_03620 [Candidatus Melainabacteria bacterium]|nr:hypothetical protein [Candidatus Melainabacteria bacterium]